MQENIIFKSTNINFVKYTKFHINNYLEMYNDKNIQKWFMREYNELTYFDEYNWIKLKLEDGYVFTLLNKNNQFIGTIGLVEIEHKSGQLTICIKTEFQNKGYGKEAIITFINYVFKTKTIDKIYLYVFKDNKKAIHCYEKCGFISCTNYKDNSHIKMEYKK